MAKEKQVGMVDFVSALQKKDESLRLGSLSDFDMTSKDSFSTGNVVLDSITGVGGFPRGRLIELYGPSQSGKTTSALMAAAAHQKNVKEGNAEGAILFLDYERSLDEDYCRALGLDVQDKDTFLYMHPKSFEQGANTFRQLLSGGYLALCIADSVAAMVSEKELQADTGAATFGDRAKALHQFCRQITGSLYDHRVSLIMLNHVMDKIDTSPNGQRMAAQGIKQKTTPGGTALPFYASMRIEFKQVRQVRDKVESAESVEEQSLVTSTDVEAKVVKNKVATPQRVGKMRVRFGKGFSQAFSVLQVLVAHKVVKKKPAGRYTFPEELLPKDGEIPISEERVVSKIEKDSEWLDRLVAASVQAIEDYKAGLIETTDVEFNPSIDPDTGIEKDDEEIDLDTGEILNGKESAWTRP